MTLADWGPISPDSALPGYTGPSSDTIVDQDDPSRFFTLQYYADQVAHFQAALIQLDQTAQVLGNDILPLLDPVADAAQIAQIQAWLDDYNAKKTEIQLAAKAINTVVNTANAFGAGLPRVTLPTNTLAQLPAIAVVGAVAAVAAAASIIAWAAEKITTAQQFTQQLSQLPPDARAAALDKMTATNTGVLSQLAGLVKWVAIGALVWFGYKAFTEERGRHAALI